jgi:MFS family permease
MMDRWGVRTVLLPVVVLCAASVALIATTPQSIIVFMLLFAVTGVLGSGQGPLGYAKCVSAWFDDRRGLALGITMSGIGSVLRWCRSTPSFSSAISAGVPPILVSACSR